MFVPMEGPMRTVGDRPIQEKSIDCNKLLYTKDQSDAAYHELTQMNFSLPRSGKNPWKSP